MEKYDDFPSMNECLERLEVSRAVSPANAAAKVISISRMEMEELFQKRNERELLLDMLPDRGEEFDWLRDWFRRVDDDDDDARRYQELMPILEELLPETGNTGARAHALDPEPDFALVYGHRFTNVMLLLALIFYDSVKDAKARKNRLAGCLRMTVGDYTDAVIDLSFTNDGKLDEEHLKRARAWKRKLVEEYGEAMPLVCVIERIINQYMEGWQMIGYAEHVVKCRDQLLWELEDQDQKCSDSLEEIGEDEYEDAHEDECDIVVQDEVPDDDSEMYAYEDDEDAFQEVPPEDPFNADVGEDYWMAYDTVLTDAYCRAMDPYGYYLGKAQEFDEELPDLEKCGLYVSSLAEMFFLDRDIYRMDVYREELSQKIDQDFLELLEEHASDAKLLRALDQVNSAVGALKVLLYDPYHGSGADDGIGKYYYERHLGA